MTQNRICLFASSGEVDPALARAVTQLRRMLGESGCSLVFGGFSDGLMRAAADELFSLP